MSNLASRYTVKEIKDKDVETAIRKTRVQLLNEHPFFGQLAIRLILAEEPEVKSLATDGRHLFYNPGFVRKLKNSGRKFAVAHEILHCVFDHIFRRGRRDPQYWNMAIDYATNHILNRDKIGEVIPNILLDKKYADMNAESIYEKLIKDQPPQQQGHAEHIDVGGDGDGDDKKQGKDGQGSGNWMPKYTKAEAEKISEEFKQNTVNAAKAAKAAGNLPAEIERLVDEYLNPKVDWRELLRRQLLSTINTNYTFNRIHKRSTVTGFYFPGKEPEETIDICVSIDASGSLTDTMVSEFMAEIKSIMDSFPTFKLHLWSHDTKVYNYHMFTEMNKDEIDFYNVKGGGGTSFDCNWDFMVENEIQPAQFVHFTDGYTGDGWGDPDYCDTLFIINSEIVAPHGITVKYESEV